MNDGAILVVCSNLLGKSSLDECRLEYAALVERNPKDEKARCDRRVTLHACRCRSHNAALPCTASDRFSLALRARTRKRARILVVFLAAPLCAQRSDALNVANLLRRVCFLVALVCHSCVVALLQCFLFFSFSHLRRYSSLRDYVAIAALQKLDKFVFTNTRVAFSIMDELQTKKVEKKVLSSGVASVLTHWTGVCQVCQVHATAVCCRTRCVEARTERFDFRVSGRSV